MKCAHGIELVRFSRPGEVVGGLIVEVAGDCVHLLSAGEHKAVIVSKAEHAYA